MLSAPHSATSDSDWRRDNPPSPPSNKGWFPGADPCSLPPPTPSDIRPYNASAHPPVNTGEHVGPAFGIGRELDLHGVGVVVDDFINMARIAAQRTTHENERLAAPAAGGGRRRIIAERIVPEQFVEAVFAVVGEDTMGRETFLAVTRLARVLDEIKTIEIDARADFRGRGTTLRPARGIDRLLARPLACKDRKLLVLGKRHRCSETVWGHAYPPLTAFTIFWAASSRLSAGNTLRPDSRIIFLPASTLVPSSRTTSGTLRPTSRTAATTPSAMTSHFMMPPKMLTRMPFTLGSAVMILKAAATFSLLALPPTSRKFAGAMP